MPNQRISSKLKEKIPSYVPIYNKLYSDIVSGVYEDGSQLPSESALTEKYGVSRNTLRQALTVLTEDGLITKSQGRGTLVTRRNDLKPTVGRHIINPMIQCAKDAVEGIDIAFNFAPPTDVARNKLGINANEIIMASNVLYLVKGKPIGRAFIQIPARHIEKIHVDLTDEDQVSALVNTTLFEIADSAILSVRVIRAEGESVTFLQVPQEEPLLYVEEILYTKEKEALARCKFYFIPEKYDVSLML